MKLLVCNLKNKLDRKSNIDYSDALENIDVTDYKLVVAPSIPFLYLYDGLNYSVASQDISSYTDKIVTGEVTGEQLVSMGVSYVIIGHSERRTYGSEINISFINKINNAQESRLNIIYCIGESFADRSNNRTYEVLEHQISEVLNNVDSKNIIIAYEPTYVIGSKDTLDKTEILETIEYIKDITFEKYETKFKVLYGGGVNKETVINLKDENIIDGFLIGSSSFEISNLVDIVDELNEK